MDADHAKSLLMMSLAFLILYTCGFSEQLATGQE